MLSLFSPVHYKNNHMRNLALVVLLLHTLLVMGQHKQMSLEDAILGRHTYLTPERIDGLSWRNDHIFSYVENDTLWSENARNGQKSPVISLTGIDALLNGKREEKLKSFPRYSWVDNDRLLVRHDRVFTLIDPEKKKVELQLELPENAENALFC